LQKGLEYGTIPEDQENFTRDDQLSQSFAALKAFTTMATPKKNGNAKVHNAFMDSVPAISARWKPIIIVKYSIKHMLCCD
jgi:hypothetical protein